MTTFYTVVSWLVILGYWVLIAGVTLRILMKRRAVPSAMAWLLIIYYSAVGRNYCLFILRGTAPGQASGRTRSRNVAIHRKVAERSQSLQTYLRRREQQRRRFAVQTL